MKRSSFGSGAVFAFLALGAAGLAGACGSKATPDGFNLGGAGSSSGGASSSGGGASSSSSGGPNPIFNTEAGAPPPGAVVYEEGGIPCPTGLTCNVSCSGGTTTTVSGKVYDPAGKDPLYNVAVYIPATPLVALPKGVPTGAAACSCDALFQSGALSNTTTAVDGTFTLTNVPVGSNVPLVIQVGKWRRQMTINVASCQDNPQADGTVKFLGSIPSGDTDDNMPDIAVSTGALDTLECLMTRIGIAGSEYVAGAGTGGHIHIFAGGNPGSGKGTGDGNAESPTMSGAPTSWTALWDKQDDMMPYDVVLLSCEGGETYNAKPAVLEQYLNAGGRAFGSHYHYAWFAGTLASGNTPAPPSDWGSNLASWGPSLSGSTSGHATITQTLSGSSGKAFPKGQALAKWLAIVGALGIEGAPSGQLPVFDENGDVGAVNKAQDWLDDNGYTDYLSFDTPVNAPVPADGGSPQYCGRAVFSDLHLNSDTNFTPQDTSPPPTGCANHALSPQEKALEFMLFDLSSCVLPDTVAPPVDAGLPPPQAK
jgi:hypothetical protein